MWEKLLDNIWLKFGSLFLAFLLWFYASSDKSYEYTFSYNLKLANLSPELILAEPLPYKVKVKFQGKGKELLKLLLFEEKKMKIDAHGFSMGKKELELQKEMIHLPEGLNLSVVEISSPKVLRLNLQKLREKKIKVASQLSFSPREGYFQKGETEFVPQEVRVRGPEEKIEGIRFVLTQKKEFHELDRAFSGSVDLLSPSYFNVKIYPQSVKFSVEIKKGEKQTLENLQVRLINLPKGRKGKLTPKTVRLELLGEKDKVEKLDPEKIEIYVDCKGLKRGNYKVSPSIFFPEDLLLLKADPDSFNLEIN